MRNAMIEEIHGFMKKDKNIYFITGDLGFSLLEEIEKDFPDRFVNVGIAEQNMMGFATGLALTGKKVYVYTIIPFAVMRCYEQIRNDICYHDVDVSIIGAGSGLSYGILSATHFALEDVALLRPLPNISIFSPADEKEALAGLKYLRNFKHPVYYRIGKKEEPIIYKDSFSFTFGKGTIVEKGNDMTIVATGTIFSEVLAATKLLRERNNIHATVIDIHTIKPIDKKIISTFARKSGLVATIEEHGVIGGLGSAVSEVLSEMRIQTVFKSIGTSDSFIKQIGSQAYLRKILHLDSLGIYKQLYAFYRSTSHNK